MSSAPLADLLRPDSLDDYIGQAHLVGEGAPIRKLLASGSLHSMILWGPPGCGKTTLARIIARSLSAEFHHLSAVSAKKEDIRQIISAKDGQNTIVFLDEIHRFNKAQQDFLLPYVENGELTLIGATTENPSFEVIGPLQSRCHTYVLKSLTEAEIGQVIDAGLARLGAKLDTKGREFLQTYASGDARKVLNILETAETIYGSKLVFKNLVDTLQSPYLRYDQAGDEISY